MNVYELEKMALRLYPDERIPVESGDPAIGEPDRIISHKKERDAFLYGFTVGFDKGVEHGKLTKNQQKRSWI